MVSILNFIVVFTITVALLLTIRYFIIMAIDSEKSGDFLDRACKIMSYVLVIVSISYFVTFIWLVHTGFIRMKIFLWIREMYFTVQNGQLLDLLVR